jgi:tetratricopeptide (TPR) repeat protein
MVRLVFAILLLSCATVAHAAPSSSALKQAKQHFAQGKASQDLGKYDEAIAEYEAAYKLAPLPKLLFNIGQCQRLKGDKPKALQAYEAYVAAAPDDESADDARDQIAALKLRIEVERAEERSRRAAEEAEAASKRAAEAESARKQWEREQAERTRAIVDEQVRQRRAADEAVERARQERVDAEVKKQQRLAAARRVGFAMRIAGPCIVVGGLAFYGSGFAFLKDGNNVSDPLRMETMWTAADDQRVQQLRNDSAAAFGMWITGIVLVVGGTTVGIVGAVKRSRAIDRAQAGR